MGLLAYIADFHDPLAFGEAIGREFEFEFGSPYVYSHIWEDAVLSKHGRICLE